MPAPLDPPPVYGREGAYAVHPPVADAAVPAPPGADAPVPAPPAAAPTAPPAPLPTATPSPGGYGPVPPGSVTPGPVPPAGGYAAPARPLPRNDLAVWSLVLGLLGVLAGCLFFTGVPAIVLGYSARRAVARGEADNDGMATAGIVLGWVATALGAVALVLVVLLAVAPLLFLGLSVPFMDVAP